MTNNELLAIKNGVLAIPSLFAGELVIPSGSTHTDDLCPVPKTDDTDVCFDNGYPSGYDNTNGSDKAIERNKFNWLLRAFSQASYFGQTGIRYTYNSDVANAIGGYPRGAVLAHDDGTSIRNVMSLVDNNTHNFLTLGVDNIHWKYLDQSDLSGIFPDYGISTYVLTAQVDSGTSSVTQCSEWTEMPRDGWIYPQFDLVDGLTTYLVIGPADGTIPTVDFSGDEYADMIPTDSVNSKNYTKFLLGYNTYSNKYVFPVKKGSKFAVFGRSTDTAPHNVYIKLFRNVS